MQTDIFTGDKEKKAANFKSKNLIPEKEKKNTVEGKTSLMQAMGEILSSNPKIEKGDLLQACKRFELEFRNKREFVSAFEKLYEAYVNSIQ